MLQIDSIAEWCILLLCITVVLTAEMFKSALESMAKAITSAYMPLGGISIEEDMYQAMLDQSKKIGVFGHGYTYSGHPVGCAAALKTLEIYERDNVLEHAGRLAAAASERMSFVRRPLHSPSWTS